MAVAKDPGGDLDRVSDGALDRVAAAVDLRRDLLDLDPRGRRLRDRHPRSLTDEEGSKRAPPPLGRRPPPSDLAPVREAGPGCVPLRRLARGGRPVVVAGPAARATRRVRLALQVAVGLRSVPAAPRPAGGAGHGRRGGGLRRAPSLLDRGLGAFRRYGGARRRGALRAGVGGAAGLRGRARRPADRRRADLRLRRRRRSRLLAGAVRPGRGRRRAARRAQRDRPALGEPAVRLACPPRDRLPLVARAFPAHPRARRPHPHRPLPRLRLLLGDSGAELDGEERTLAARPRRRALPRGRARARRPAADRGGSRPHHAARLRAAGRARITGDGRAPLGLPPPQAQPAQSGQPPAQLGRVHEHARHRHRRRLVLEPTARASAPPPVSIRTSRTGA